MVDQDSDRCVVAAVVRAHAELVVTENGAGVAAVCGEDRGERLLDSQDRGQLELHSDTVVNLTW